MASFFVKSSLRNITFLLLISAAAVLFQQCRTESGPFVKDGAENIVVKTDHYQLIVEKAGFKYQLLNADGEVIAAAHPVSGLQISRMGEPEADVAATSLLSAVGDELEFVVETTSGLGAKVHLSLLEHALKLAVVPVAEDQYSIILRTAGMGTAYGMADNAAYDEGSGDLVLDNFVRDPLVKNNGSDRMISNFAIFPKSGLAEVNMEAGWKVVRLTSEENAQGSREVRSLPAFYYFIGQPTEIYRAFLDARNAEGYPVFKPKSAWFGVGWEAFGALAWSTNQETVTENVNQYLDMGYPLSWMVVGSGFWPRGSGEFDAHGTPYGSSTTSEDAKKLQATTSFGMWDPTLYPDPRGLIDHFHQRGLIFTIGLRIGFIPGGPFTNEGLEKGYFLTDEQGQAQEMKVGFPRVPVYLLNSKKQEAVDWYVQLCDKWAAYGIDGYKEDLFHWPKELPDDLIDPVNRALMAKGVYIMGRNNYLGSPADIHRYDDFNYNQNQDRGPINGLAYAFSGFPNVYPDIVGGTGLATGRFGNEPIDKLKIYLVRYAQFAALNPSMAFGYGPWNFDEKTNALCLQAAQLHHRLMPHIYSNAVRAYETGFPYPMTPLPLAYPADPGVYGLADTTHHQYEWLIGESLLAAPLYGNDYDRAVSRDIYLPAGQWIDYETGQRYEGPQTLKDFAIPLEKIPLFVGGTGLVIEQEGDQLLARLYPIQKQSNTTFWHTDGELKGEINIAVQDWKNITVVTGGGQQVPAEMVRHAWQFVLEPGKTYQIK